MKTNDPNNPVQPIQPSAGQLAQRRVFLTTFAPLLPYNVQVQHRSWGRGILMGLPLNHVLEQPYAEVKFTYGGEQEVCSGIVALADLKPVLHPFSVLGEHANTFRTDATAHAAMMDLARAFHGSDEVAEIADAGFHDGHLRGRIWLEYQDDDGYLQTAEIWSDGAGKNTDELVQMADYLRERQYAVGLLPTQYISF